MSELEKYQAEDIETTWRRAKGYALSGYFADAKSAEQAFVKISAGAEMGLTPFQAMSGIHIIEGKPVVGAGLLAAMVDQHDDYDYTVTWTPDAQNATSCTVTILKNGTVKGESSFSMQDAERAGLTKPSRNGKPSNYNVYGRNMLFARAMSNAVRWYAPGVTGTSTYVEGEIPSFNAPQPDQPVAKPRTRVTAEVVREAVEHVEGEVINDDEAPQPLRAQLTHMSAQEKADLWRFASLSAGTKMADVKSRLVAYADELGVEFTEEPNARLILDAARAAAKASLPDDAVEEFDHFAQTGQDLEADPQTAIA